MKKAFYRAAVLGALALAVAMPASAGAAAKQKHFTLMVIGAPVSSTENVYAVQDSRHGAGAAVQIVSINGTSGTDTITLYYKNGSVVGHNTFTIGAPDANGIIAITGHGTAAGKTGALKGAKWTYTFTGTLNSKTNVAQLSASATGNK